MKNKRMDFGICAIILIMIFALLCVCMCGEGAAAPASDKEIKIALVYPLSGALSRSGNLAVQGIKAAMNWVNENGGIKSLGGAKLVPVIVDSGSTVEGAGNAMERVLRDQSITIALGSWSSSLTFGSTEVSERQNVLQFSSGIADKLHERGFKWGFYPMTPVSLYPSLGINAALDLAKAAGNPVKTVMMIGDNNAASLMFYEEAKKALDAAGVKLLGQIEIYTAGTLTDASPLMRKVKASNPDMIILGASAINEAQLILMKKRELGIDKPVLCSGGFGGDPALVSAGWENIEGMLVITDHFPNKRTPKDWIKSTLDQCKKEYSSEPWVAQDLFLGWVIIPVIKEILERAASTDRQVLWDAARKLDISNVITTTANAGQGMAFESNGRIAKKYQKLFLIQWQKGVPRVVYPTELAESKPMWPKTK